MTKNFVRLTPATQSKKGWLWNDYPMESNWWEVELKFLVHSQPHFGGDGFGVWILSGDYDPIYHWEPDYLNGPIFGIRQDFRGFGVIFDTYDNDGKRDNPTVSVISNFDGEIINDNDNDFNNVMVKSVAVDGRAFKCFSSYRNTKDPYNVMIRYVDNVLHVYVKDASISSRRTNDYKYCLSVTLDLPKSFDERHLAFTSMTGQVADAVDILEIKTRYISENDARIDDAALLASEGHMSSRWSAIYWLVALIAGAVLTLWAVRDLSYVSQVKNEQTNPVYVCTELNRMMMPHMVLHFALCAYLVVSGSTLALLLNIPLVGYRLYTIATSSYLLDPAVLTGGGKGHRRTFFPYSSQLIAFIAVYSLSTLLYFVKLSDS